MSPALSGRFFSTELPGTPENYFLNHLYWDIINTPQNSLILVLLFNKYRILVLQEGRSRRLVVQQCNHNGVITHLEPDILVCEIKWASGSVTMNKASGSDGIPAELFQILNYKAVKVLHSICQQIWKTQQWPQDWKRSVFIPVPKKGNAKECSHYHTVVLIHMPAR